MKLVKHKDNNYYGVIDSDNRLLVLSSQNKSMIGTFLVGINVNPYNVLEYCNESIDIIIDNEKFFFYKIDNYNYLYVLSESYELFYVDLNEKTINRFLWNSNRKEVDNFIKYVLKEQHGNNKGSKITLKFK